jgi:hypothetical protein
MFFLRRKPKGPYDKLLDELRRGERYLAALDDEPGLLGESRLAMARDHTATRVRQIKEELRRLGYKGEL